MGIKKKIALIGADGQLGIDLLKFLPHNFNVIPLTITDIDITNQSLIENCLSKYNPEIILSTAGFHNVPLCEENPDNAFLVNTVGAKYLSDWSYYHNCKLVFISTDYVFNGNKRTPYSEDDIPDPINIYGLSKYAGEIFIKNHVKDYLIIRTTGLYGANTCLGKPTPNFVEMFLNLIKGKENVDFDGREICCPTYTLDLANQIAIMLQNDLKGLFHAVNEGACSWFEFGQAIIKEYGFSTKLHQSEKKEIIPKNTKKFQPLRRPYYTALENKNLKQLNLNIMKSWSEALHNFIQYRKINK